MTTTAKVFLCPQCAKTTLSIHRKTYEKVIVAFCDNCRFNFCFEPSEEAYYDENKTLEEFQINYEKTRQKTKAEA